MSSEDERVSQIESNLGDAYRWNPVDKTIEAAGSVDPDNPSMPVSKSDLGHAVNERRQGDD